MKTPAEQQAALLLVGKEAARSVVNWGIMPADGGDVAFLTATVPQARQIVPAVSGPHYDIWSANGTRLLETNVSLEKAAKVVVDDYKIHKINLIMTRLIGGDWQQREHRDLLKRITTEVYDSEGERRRSEKALKENK